ncbi:MAG: folate-binding protein YgfZ [Gammaproteobacteria bacterium]
MTASILDNASTPDHFSTDLDKPTLIRLNHLVCYQVEGEDATTFLQGQFSNDINAVTTSAGQISSYCTPKGRMLAIFYICKRGDTYHLLTSKDVAEGVMKRLQMYVMRSKVSIKPMEDVLLLGVYNDDHAKVLDTLQLTSFDSDYQVSANDDCLGMNIPNSSSPRYLIICKKSSALLQELSIDATNIYSHSYWQWLDIMAGLPSITQNVQEAFVPQMANMELIQGVSFSKGCYPGQEIVARLHYLGNANRRMFRLEASQDKTINAGDDIYSQDSDQAIGKFLSVVHEGNNKYSALAVLRIEAAKKNQLAIGSSSGNSAQIMPLPYDVPTDLKEKEK